MALRAGTTDRANWGPSADAASDLRVVKAHADGRSPERVAAEALERLKDSPDADDPDVAIVLASVDLCTPRAFDVLQDGLGRVPLIGCSTFAQIVDGEEHASGIAIATLRSRQAHFRAFSAYDIEADPEGHAQDLADSIVEECDAPVALLVLADGFGQGAETFVQRLGLLLPSRVKIAGALACGDPAVGRSYQVHGERMMTRGAVVLAIDGKVRAAADSAHGLIGLGRTSAVSEARGTTLVALDDAPAVDLYRRYLGERVEELPAIGEVYPLGFGKPGIPPLIRTVRNVDWGEGSLELSGPVEAGTEARVMLAQRDTLLREARRLGESLRRRFDRAAGFALVFPYAARRAVFAEDRRGEAACLLEALAPTQGALGFHSSSPLGKDGAVGSAVSVLAV